MNPMLNIMPKIASRRAAVLGVLLVSGVFVFWSAVWPGSGPGSAPPQLGLPLAQVALELFEAPSSQRPPFQTVRSRPRLPAFAKVVIREGGVFGLMTPDGLPQLALSPDAAALVPVQGHEGLAVEFGGPGPKDLLLVFDRTADALLGSDLGRLSLPGAVFQFDRGDLRVLAWVRDKSLSAWVTRKPMAEALGLIPAQSPVTPAPPG
ncbi:MAG: hypothetical protein EXR76_02400 [Myxococcales bacterium]|nr:hypothetical protein [Myxococcales bacterium]